MKQRILTLVVLVAVTFSSGYFVGTFSHETNPVEAQDTSRNDPRFNALFEAWDLLHENYVDPLDDDTLFEGIMNGLMGAPGDPHTDYMNPERYTQAREGLNSTYEGIGATVNQDDVTGALIITRPLPGSPAEAAGLLPGDQVMTVNGEDITGLDQSVIIGMVRGPAGTDVVLGVQREGSEAIIEITVTRAQIILPSLDYEVLDGDIAYVQLFNFAQNSDEELANALIELDVENLNGLILDVRGNTGGYLDTTLEIISMFISRGTIFIERGVGGVENKVQAYGNPITPSVPMVLLVDGNSASASELLAGALQDYDRAEIIGTRTFGKGSVQTWRDLSNGGGIRITIARWFTPLGRSVEPDGIEPDTEVEYIAPEVGQPYVRSEDNQIQAAIDYLEDSPRGPQASIPMDTTPTTFG